MSEQTSGAETVLVPGQTRGAADREGYLPRHRAEATRAEEPTVVPPSGHLASQRRARAAATARARSAAVRSVAHVETDVVRRVYDTPVWVPSARVGEAAGHLPALLPVDDGDALSRPDGMIRNARWSSPHRANLAAGFLLAGFLAAAAATSSGLLRRQSTPTLALALACLLGAAGVYALLVVLRPVVVELAEPWLSVQAGSRLERFNLASPFQELHVSGRPGTRSWQLVLGCADGRRAVRLRRSMVDSRDLHVVVTYARALADRERAAREERFNR